MKAERVGDARGEEERDREVMVREGERVRCKHEESSVIEKRKTGDRIYTCM